MLISSCLATALLTAASAAAAAAALPPNGSPAITYPIPPRSDPWYTAPSGYEDALPGEVLRWRPAQGSLNYTFANISEAYNIMYRTADSHYEPSWAVTTLLVPEAPLDGDYSAVIGYAMIYDSADPNSSPSYSMSYFSPLSGWSENTSVVEIQECINMGWYVTVPDYEGPLASFGAGVTSGLAFLDGIRASVSSTWGLPQIKNPRFAMWGYSGGTIPGDWAAELQPSWAPELKFHGMAIGGMTPVLFNVFNTITSTKSAGIIPAGVLGLASQWPEVQTDLLSKLLPNGTQNAARFMAAGNMTLSTACVDFYGEDIYDYFVNKIEDFMTAGVQSVLAVDGTMGNHGVPQMPMFVYEAVQDDSSPIADTDALVAKYCAAGSVIQYERNDLGLHKDNQDRYSARAFDFLARVIAETWVPPLGGCSVTNVSLPLPP
ncbi:secretory lipase-domain-containing protein [Xylariales sp. PMI_506]|nr:secretory lipase-domain-containing protein [Xylariales sp. PMI_506]